MTVWIALAGGLGAAVRLLVDGLIRDGRSSTYPWATTLINVSGAFLLGLLMAGGMGTEAKAIVGIGFLGGYTTFSTASIETARLAHDGRYRAALANSLGMLLIAVAAAALGYCLGSR